MSLALQPYPRNGETAGARHAPMLSFGLLRWTVNTSLPLADAFFFTKTRVPRRDPERTVVSTPSWRALVERSISVHDALQLHS